MILGTGIFLLIFLLLAPQSRAILDSVANRAGDWMERWAPYSYLVVVASLLVPLIALLIMFQRPTAPKRQKPLASYRGDDVLED